MNKRIDVRHPEKLKNQPSYMAKKPPWIKVKSPLSQGYIETKKLVSSLSKLKKRERLDASNKAKFITFITR